MRQHGEASSGILMQLLPFPWGFADRRTIRTISLCTTRPARLAVVRTGARTPPVARIYRSIWRRRKRRGYSSSGEAAEQQHERRSRGREWTKKRGLRAPHWHVPSTAPPIARAKATDNAGVRRGWWLGDGRMSTAVHSPRLLH